MEEMLWNKELNIYCVEFCYFRDEGGDQFEYTSRYFSRKITLEDIFEFKKQEPFQEMFRLYEIIGVGINQTETNSSPWVVFNENCQSKDKLTISKASYLFEGGQDLIKKLEQ